VLLLLSLGRLLGASLVSQALVSQAKLALVQVTQAKLALVRVRVLLWLM